MTDKNMVCNGHKENKIEKNTTHNSLFPLDKLRCDTSRINSPTDTMTIGSVPFPKFDHLYASSIEDSETNSTTMDVVRSCLNSCHLDMIEEQDRIIESQKHEIFKLRKQNESLIARMERMNRRMNLNQCSRRMSIKYSNAGAEENSFGRRNNNSFDGTDFRYQSCTDAGTLLSRVPNTSMGENRNTNFRIRFRSKETGLREEHRKCSKMVRFVEAKRSNAASSAADKSVKRTQAVEEKLKLDDAVLFLKTSEKSKSADEVVPENHVADSDSEDLLALKKKRLKFPILTSHELFHMAAREDINCPVTYTPTALEVPSYRVIERDNNIDPSDVPSDYCEDITVEAAKERHTRFEVDERKRKKWDVQRIRELRQNEILKEKLSRRKSRWNKLDSPKMMNMMGSEHISSLFPDMKNIEKIMITNVVPVTALGTTIAKIPSWGTDFHTPWMNDGTVDASQFEENENPSNQHYLHPRTTRQRTV